MVLINYISASRFLSLAGAITGSHASYHSKYVLDEVKRRKMLIALETSDARNAVKSRLRDSVAEIHRRKSVGRGRIVYSKSIDDQLLKADEEEVWSPHFFFLVYQFSTRLEFITQLFSESIA